MANSYIDKFREELRSYAIKVRDEYTANQSVGKYKIKFLIVKQIIDDVKTLNDEKSVRVYLNILLNNSRKTKKIYDELYAKYIKETDKKEKTKLIRELNEYGARLNAYNECYNIIAKSFTKGDNLNNDDTQLSDRIIALLVKYNELDKKTTEANKLLEQVYDLRVQREQKFKELYGNNYRKYVSEIESIENMAAATPPAGFKPKQLDSESLILELRTAINAINEYYFIDELQIKKFYKSNNNMSDGVNDNKCYKKYTNFLRNYHVLITSLFKNRTVEFKVNGITLNTEDLLSYLETVNLDGDFSVYKAKFGEYKIGNETPDKKKYNESLLFLNECINSLCLIVRKESKGKMIKIVDKEPTRSSIIKERNNKLKEFYFLSRMEPSSGVGKKL